MRVFVIPSWFPSLSHPNAGIFFREQTEMYAERFPEDKIGLVSWGQNDQRLLLERSQFFHIPQKLIGARKIKSSEWEYEHNYLEWFLPRFTWTRKVFKGNIGRIIKACDLAFSVFTARYGKPDLIHAHVGYPGGYVAWKLAEKYQIPFVITEHMGPFPFADFKRGSQLDPKLSNPLKQAHQLLAVSAHLKKEMERYGIASSVFHNFIDDDFFQTTVSLGREKRIRLLHIGRLAPEKRQADLLKAISLLPGSFDFELKIAGEGPLRAELQAMINELGLAQRVTLIGDQNREQIREYLQASDIMILSSAYENFPVSILEALACGKPVVATKCGGPEEMINDLNGLLANSNDPADLSEQIQRVISNLSAYDPMAIRNDFMARYGRENALEKLRQTYQQTLDDYHSR